MLCYSLLSLVCFFVCFLQNAIQTVIISHAYNVKESPIVFITVDSELTQWYIGIKAQMVYIKRIARQTRRSALSTSSFNDSAYYNVKMQPISAN